MGLYAATSIGVGAMIRAGIFSTFGTAVKISGSAVYISFIIAGIVALLNGYLLLCKFIYLKRSIA